MKLHIRFNHREVVVDINKVSEVEATIAKTCGRYLPIPEDVNPHDVVVAVPVKMFNRNGWTPVSLRWVNLATGQFRQFEQFTVFAIVKA